MYQASEFAKLSDLALKQGIPHSALLAEIHERILSEYKIHYPKKTQTVSVIVDEATGEAKIMRDNMDITPQDFKPIAEKIARETVIEKLVLQKEQEPEKEIVQGPKKESSIGKWLMNILFWGYNLSYFFILLIFVNNFATNPAYRNEIFDVIKNLGTIRTIFIVTSGLVPVISMFAAVKLSKKTAAQLGTLFFLFEIPLVVVPLFLINIFTSPTPVMWFLLTLVIVTIPAFLINLLDFKFESASARTVIAILNEFITLILGYITVLFTFIVPVILGTIAKTVTDYFGQEVFGSVTSTYYRPYFNPLELIFVLFFGGIGIFVILSLTFAPYLLFVTTMKNFLKSARSLAEKTGKDTAQKILLSAGIALFIIFAAVSYQPNPDKYLDKLETFKQKTTFEEREALAKELLPQEARIKRAFDDLNNVRSRYLMAKDDNFIKDAYIEVLNFTNIPAELVQQAFMAWAYPFVYQGNLDRMGTAYEAYQYLFGKSPYGYYTPPQSAFNNANVKQRLISASTDYEGLLATITTEEEYTTNSTADQEVIYEFSLPPDSVVTSLSLGPDLEFPGIIAPKGAASKTYQQEVRQRRDPALLEETGPNQYRLRVFPIPGVRNTIIRGRNEKVQFKYTTPLTFKGFGLPVYSKEQNVNLGKVRYTVDGTDVNSDGTFLKNDRIASAISGLCSNKNILESHSKLTSEPVFLVPNIAIESLSGKINCDGNGFNLTPAASGMRLAILFDVSYSDKDNGEISRIENVLTQNDNFLKTNLVDIYKFNELMSLPVRLNSSNSDVFNFTYFGTSDWIKSLNSFTGQYDAAIVITGNSDPPLKQNYNLGKSMPVYIVHTGKVPPYTTSVTGQILQEGGGTFSNFEDALNTAIISKNANTVLNGNHLVLPGIVFSYYSKEDTSKLVSDDWANIKTQNDPLTKIVAKKLTDKKIAGYKGNLDSDLTFLDTLNIFAVNNVTVTPFSSLIALVNERQLQSLGQQAQNLDRYKETASGTGGWTPITNPVSPFSRSINLAPGGSMMALDVGGGGGGGNFGALANPGVGVSRFGGSSFGLLSSPSFLWINLLILGGGISVFIILKLTSFFKTRGKKQVN